MLKVGQKAPSFILKDKNGVEFDLANFLGEKHFVIYFYPKNGTPGCNKEACAFRDNYEAFTDAGAEVIGISADSIQSHANFASKRQLPFVLLSDPDLKVHGLYDVSPSLFGLWKERATYVVDKDGIVKLAFKSQLSIDKHIKDALKTIQEIS